MRATRVAKGIPGYPTLIPLEGFLHLPSNSRLVSRGPSAVLPSTPGAVFLDRDGVLVQDVHFLTRPGQIRVLPGVLKALTLLRKRFYTIVVTNQSAIARGLLTEEELLAIHTELVRRLSPEDALVDAMYYCPHLPAAPMAQYAVTCDCRKPRPGMLLRAAADWGIDLGQSFLVGDATRDMEAALAVGAQGIMVGQGHPDRPAAVWVAQDLMEATRVILARKSSPEGGPTAQVLAPARPDLDLLAPRGGP